jgi:hypothetical protein
METEIKARWKWGGETGNSIHMQWGGLVSKFFLR